MSYNEDLLYERNWLTEILTVAHPDDLEIVDAGLGAGEVGNFVYERHADRGEGRLRVSVTIRIEDQ